MAWPPGVLPVNRTDSLTQQTNHPADHNAANLAINDTVAHVQFLEGNMQRYGTICRPGGQAIASGQVVNIAGVRSLTRVRFGFDPDDPIGRGGVYTMSVRSPARSSPPAGTRSPCTSTPKGSTTRSTCPGT